ncbi:MAG: hypothetical protein QOK49_4536 [Baekduia sp.]|nr:hypothetical protein [Baekduia sp.]
MRDACLAREDEQPLMARPKKAALTFHRRRIRATGASTASTLTCAELACYAALQIPPPRMTKGTSSRCPGA